jgi:hypothetical protein
MKMLAGIALTGFLIAGHASAGTVYLPALCGLFVAAGSGTFACPTYASLGGTAPVAAEFLVEDSNYAIGANTSASLVTNFSYSGGPAQFTTDTVTSTGTPGTSGIPSSLNLGSFEPPNAITGAYAGFYDNVNSPFGTVTVNYTTTITNASGLAGYVQVVYAYNTPATTPEPVSLVLCGTGLLALALFAQRRLARR